MAGRGKKLGKLVATVRMYIPAGKASPSPPLGPALGQVLYPTARYDMLATLVVWNTHVWNSCAYVLECVTV